MKKLLTAATALTFMAGMAMADPLVGKWLTAPDDNGNRGLIDIKVCGTTFCGVLVAGYNADGVAGPSENIGRQIIFDTVPHGGGKYSGKVYAPDRDKTYNSKLELSGDSLAVAGCVFGICRNGGNWTRQ